MHLYCLSFGIWFEPEADPALETAVSVAAEEHDLKGALVRVTISGPAVVGGQESHVTVKESAARER